MLLYLVVYAVATTGTFAALAYLGRGDRQIDAVDELAGLRVTHPVVAAALAVFMFSLAGIPPLAGFWGKFALFAVALDVQLAGQAAEWIRPWFIALAIAGVLNAAIAAAYYLRVVAVMYFRSPVAAPPAQGGRTALAAALASAVMVVAVGSYPWPLIQRANQASEAAQDEFASRELETTTRTNRMPSVK
jgi:NADH-quinone oxidoreductase subunit N